jgi:predicted dehydrogenase
MTSSSSGDAPQDNTIQSDDSHSTARPKKTGIVIVGCGQIMTHHVEQIAGTGEPLHIIALCDPNPKRRQVLLECGRHYGVLSDSVREYNTLTEFLSHDNDPTQVPQSSNPSSDSTSTTTTTTQHIIVIALPHDLHEPVALEALGSGHHVVLEKPLAPTLASCRTIQKAASADQDQGASSLSRGMLIVAEQSPYWEEIVLAQQLIRRGDIGTVISAASYFYESLRTCLTSGIDETDGGLGWRRSVKRAGGGIVIDGGLHWIRPLRVLCGDVESVVGVTRNNVQPGLQMEGETLAHALFKMKSPPPSSSSNSEEDEDDEFKYLRQPEDTGGPLVATFSCNFLYSAPLAHDMCPYFRITGTKGELVVSGTGLDPIGGGGLRLYNDDNLTGKDMFPKDRQGAFYLGFRGLWKEISRILRDNDRVAAAKTVEDAAQDVAVALALYESARTGQWVDLESIN